MKEDEEKAAKAEEKRLVKEKRKSKEGSTAQKSDITGTTVVDSAAAEPEDSTIAERREAATLAPIRTSMEMQAEQRMKEAADAANKGEATPLSPGSSPDGSKVKNWLKTKFSRRMSRGQKPKSEEGNDKGFVGGAALTGASVNNGSNSSLNNRDSSIRDVALAGKTSGPEERPGRTVRRTSDVSSISSMGDGDEFEEARDNFDEGLAPPPTFPAGPAKSSSPVRDSKFHEVM